MIKSTKNPNLIANYNYMRHVITFIHVHDGIIFWPETYVKEIITWRHMHAVGILVYWLSLWYFWSRDTVDHSVDNTVDQARDQKWFEEIDSENRILEKF